MVHWRKLRIEGFQPGRLISECLAKGISLQEIRVHGDLEMTLCVFGKDYERLIQLVKNRYRITVLKEKGLKPTIFKMFSHKATLIGVIIFAFLMYYQSLFVAEIRVYGYEAIPEMQIRQSLRTAGFYEGCRKDLDMGKIKQAVYNDLDGIVWLSISCKGTLAEVVVVEGSQAPPVLKEETPCHIVAARDGYIEEIIPKEGLRTVEDGTYVYAGQVVISGVVPLAPTAYGTDAALLTERYVHAMGTVKAKVPYRTVFYLSRYERIHEKTGRQLYGVRFDVGDKTVDTLKIISNYEVSQRISRNLFETTRPFPIKVTLLKDEEVTLSKREKNETELRSEAETRLRDYIQENLPNGVQILNKSLNFSLRENIIEVSVMFEALQEIGKEQEILFGESADRSE